MPFTPTAGRAGLRQPQKGPAQDRTPASPRRAHLPEVHADFEDDTATDQALWKAPPGLT